MKSTKNYNLYKPEYTDAADIEILNANADKIDFEIDLLNKEIQNFTTEINDPRNVAQFVATAKSYYDRRGDTSPYLYEYGQTTALDDDYYETGANKRLIDCSTLVGLCLRGIDFDHSPYSQLITGSTALDVPVKANRDIVWSVDPFNVRNKKEIYDVSTAKVRTASQLAEMYAKMGRVVDHAPDFSNIEAGDIVFYSRKDSQGAWTQPLRYRKISHVAIVASKRPADAGSDYPYKHTMYEATTGAKVLLNRTLEETLVDTITMFVRPDLSQINPNNASYKLISDAANVNLNNVFDDGFYLLSSSTTQGLPTGVNNGLYQQLKVESTYNDHGKPYAIVQTLINANTGDMYVRTQYCYSNTPSCEPSADTWKTWRKISMT